MARREGSPEWFDRDIIFPSSDFEHEAVRHAQRVMRVYESGLMDETTRARLQGIQGLFRLKITGMLDLPTAIKLEEIREHYA